jgi:hypothetical protein
MNTDRKVSPDFPDELDKTTARIYIIAMLDIAITGMALGRNRRIQWVKANRHPFEWILTAV